MKSRADRPKKTVGIDNALIRSDLRQLHKLVEEISSYAEEPSMWPLTQQEQVSFVRSVIYQARKMRNTEPYVTSDVMLAVEEFARSLASQSTDRKAL